MLRCGAGGRIGRARRHAESHDWRARFDDRYVDLGPIHHTCFVSEVIQSPVAATRERTHTASFSIAYELGL
jgi:hypothetical protein